MKRRKFIAASGLAITGGILGSTVSNVLGNVSANDMINVGVIGTGSRGNGLLKLLKKVPSIRPVAVCDIIPFRLDKGVKAANEKVSAYNDYRKLLENEDVDAVIISTPFSEHDEMALDSIEAGKHIFCEKTMAKGIVETKALVKKVASSDLVFQVGHQYHSSRLYQHAVDMIKDGEIGKIAKVECQWNRNGDWRRKVPDPQYEQLINWRMYRQYSGGLVAELCSHQMDFCNWILQQSPQKIMGVGGIDYWKDGRETYDNIHLIIDYPEGVKATFTCLTSNALGDYKIKVLGDKGTITLDYKKAWLNLEGKKNKKMGDVDGVSGATIKLDMLRSKVIDVEHADPTLQALIDFGSSIRNNKEPITNVHTGAKVSFMVQMALDAMDNNRIEHWKPEYDL